MTYQSKIKQTLTLECFIYMNAAIAKLTKGIKKQETMAMTGLGQHIISGYFSSCKARKKMDTILIYPQFKKYTEV